MDTMMTQIGETAGKIWALLNEKEKILLSQLPKEVNEKAVIAHQGLGWLAREGKIEYSVENRKIYVALKKV